MLRRVPILLIPLLILVPAARAAPTRAQLCEAALELAAARYARCRLLAEQRYSKSLDAERRTTALTRCSRNLAEAFARATAKYGADCAATEPSSAFEEYLMQCTDDVAAAGAGAELPDYAGCAAELAACTANLATCSAELEVTVADLEACEAELAACPPNVAHLIVNVAVHNERGGTATASDFGVHVGGAGAIPSSFPGEAAPGTIVTVTPGQTFLMAVTNPAPGYFVSFLGSCGSEPLAPGAIATCTVKAEYLPARLHVIKTVRNDDGGTAVASDWTIHVANANPSPSSFPGTASPGVEVAIDVGPYSVTESGGPDGYQASFSGCSGTAVVGGVYVCEIVNDDVAPTP